MQEMVINDRIISYHIISYQIKSYQIVIKSYRITSDQSISGDNCVICYIISSISHHTSHIK